VVFFVIDANRPGARAQRGVSSPVPSLKLPPWRWQEFDPGRKGERSVNTLSQKIAFNLWAKAHGPGPANWFDIFRPMVFRASTDRRNDCRLGWQHLRTNALAAKCSRTQDWRCTGGGRSSAADGRAAHRRELADCSKMAWTSCGPNLRPCTAGRRNRGGRRDQTRPTAAIPSLNALGRVKLWQNAGQNAQPFRRPCGPGPRRC